MGSLSTRSRAFFAAAAAAVAIAGTARAIQTIRSTTFDRFHDAVAQYVQLRQQIERTVPPFQVSSDVHAIAQAVAVRAAEIRRVRPTARVGDILTTEDHPAFRAVIGRALRTSGSRVRDLLEAQLEEQAERQGDDRDAGGMRQLIVNEPFPPLFGRHVPPLLLSALPVLPEFLQYRLAGRDLVLIDEGANVVIDVLENALPVPEPEGT
jgi:hypothetical protein